MIVEEWADLLSSLVADYPHVRVEEVSAILDESVGTVGGVLRQAPVREVDEAARLRLDILDGRLHV